jgi:hypothetical protein
MPSGLEFGLALHFSKQAELVAKREHFGSGRFKETCKKVSKLLTKAAGRSTLKYLGSNKLVQASVTT